MLKPFFFIRRSLPVVFSIAVALMAILIPAQSFARSWDDLYEKTSEKLIGSEKERKIKKDVWIFYQKEDWENHYSLMALEFYKYTDYPKYESRRVIPFWYGISSKVDNRSMGFIPILLAYWETDGKENYRLNPFFYDNIYTDGSTYERNSFSLFHYYSFERRSANKKGETVFWAPIIPLTYHSTDDYGGHRNFLWLLDYSWDTVGGEDSMKRFWLMPILFHSSGNDGYTIINPLWIDNRHENGERYMHLLPLFRWSKDISYHYDGNGKSHNEHERSFLFWLYCFSDARKDSWDSPITSKSFWFPIIPLFYSYSETEGESHRNVLWFFDWHNDSKESTDRFWLTPFVFWKNENYFHVLPPVYMSFKEHDYSYNHLLPLFLNYDSTYMQYNPDSRKNEPVYSSTFVSLWTASYKEHKDSYDGEIISSTRSIPIIPILYFSSEEKGIGSHRNIISLFDWHNDSKESIDRFWLTPIVFWKSENYLHVLPPVYMSFKGKDYSYNHLLPLFIDYNSVDAQYNRDTKKYEPVYSSSFISLWNVSFKDRSSPDGEVISSTAWFPIIPVLYYSSEEKGIGSHRNIAGLVDWHKDANGITDRRWFTPLVFWKSGNYLHILPPVYMSFSGKDYSYSHLLPFYLNYNSKESSIIEGKSEPVDNYSFFTLFSGWSASKNSATGESLSRSVWVPIIPLVYDNRDETGTHTNAFWLVDWARDRFGGLERFWIIPLVFYREGPGGYRVFGPFYIKPSGWTSERGYSFGLFHYNSWSSESDTTWILPVWFNHNNRETGNYVNLVLPLYYNVESKERDTTLFLPLYFNTENKKNGNKLHINILGLSRSIANGPNPNIDLGAGKSQYGYYLDTEISWLYEAFSISTRTTLYQTTPKTEMPPLETKLTNKSSLSKDDAVNYWGFNVLFGWLNFKSADTKYHFRLLPLCWLTWDSSQNNDSYWALLFYHSKTPDDSLYVMVPFFFSYTSKESDYFALTPAFIPLYGSQHTGNSYRYMFFDFFWNEYDDEQKLHEYTILWPLINFYSSPVKGGSRFAPFYWYKRVTDGTREYSRTIIPLLLGYYRSHTEDLAAKETIASRSVSLLHYYHFEKNERAGGITDTDSSLLIWPLLTFSSSSATENANHEKTESRTKFITPLYISHVTEKTATEKDSEETGRTFCLGYYSSYNPEIYYWTFLGLVSSTTNRKDKDADYSSSWLFGLHNHSREDGVYSNYTFPLYSYESWNDGYSFRFLLGLVSRGKDTAKNESSTSLLYWFFSTRTNREIAYNDNHSLNVSADVNRTWLIPFFYTRSSESSDPSKPFRSRMTFTLPVYWYSENENSYDFLLCAGLFSKDRDEQNDNLSYSWSALWWLASSRTTLTTTSRTDKNYTREKSNSWMFPLLFTHYEDYTLDAINHTERTTISPLFVSNYETNNGKGTDLLYWAPIVPLIFYHSTDTFSHLDVALLFDYEADRSTGTTTKRFAPLYFSRNGSDGYFCLFPPLFMSWWNDAYNEDSKFILGLFVTRSPEYERQNLLYLFDHIKNIRENRETTSLLFGSLSKETSAQDVEYSFLWGAGFKYRGSTVNDDYERTAAFYLIAQKQLGDYYQNRFLPFWYYSSNKNESNLLIPPLLTYINRNTDGSKFDVVGLGTLWYRNYNASKGSDRQMVLFGIPYYAVSRPEDHGYSSVGSLWGFLWDDETESETGFKKFSVLKGVYKSVTLDGKTTQSILFLDF